MSPPVHVHVLTRLVNLVDAADMFVSVGSPSAGGHTRGQTLNAQEPLLRLAGCVDVTEV